MAVDPGGTRVATRRFVVNAGTAAQLEKWSERRFAVEGATGLGRGIAQILVAGGEDVVDVPSTLAMKVRVFSTGGGRKNRPRRCARYRTDCGAPQGLTCRTR